MWACQGRLACGHYQWAPLPWGSASAASASAASWGPEGKCSHESIRLHHCGWPRSLLWHLARSLADKYGATKMLESLVARWRWCSA